MIDSSPGLPSAQSSVIRKINATLQGPVVDALITLVPDVAKLPRQTALERILDDSALLSRCFMAFRSQPEQFRHLLVNRFKVPVDDAEAVLECGRSLDEVVAMVVRTAAKRHFRRKLDGTSDRRKPAKARQDLIGRLVALLAAPKPRVPSRTRAEVLYAEFQDYLRYDWQVPLVGEYATFSPHAIRRIGQRIFDYRLPSDVRKLRQDEDYLPSAKMPPLPSLSTVLQRMRPDAPPLADAPPPPSDDSALPAAISGNPRWDLPAVDIDISGAARTDSRAQMEQILARDGKRLKGSAFALDLMNQGMRDAVPLAAQSARAAAMLDQVSGLAARQLVGALGLSRGQLAAFLLSTCDGMGEENFIRAFGLPGRLDYVAKITERALAANIGQDSSPAQIAAVLKASFKPRNEA